MDMAMPALLGYFMTMLCEISPAIFHDRGHHPLYKFLEADASRLGMTLENFVLLI